MSDIRIKVSDAPEPPERPDRNKGRQERQPRPPHRGERQQRPDRQAHRPRQEQQSKPAQEQPVDPSMIVNLTELQRKSPKDLVELAKEHGLENLGRARKQEIVFALGKRLASKKFRLTGDGELEVLSDGYGFLRSAISYFSPGPDDIYVSPNLIRKYGLRTGDVIEGDVRAPKEGERYLALKQVSKINFEEPDKAQNKIPFENLTPMFPDEAFKLERGDGSPEDVTPRLIDMIAPVGKGQRALIVSPPKAGKTMMMQNIAKSIAQNHPEVYLMVLLVDERPEEVTDMERSVKGEVVAATFDEPATRHVQVAEMVIEKAKRLVEHKRDVVILLDSITRLCACIQYCLSCIG